MEKQRYWRNSFNQWGLASRLLHWGMAILILGMLSVGLYMVDLPNSPFKFSLYNIHKATGIVVLALLVFRLIWRLAQTVPTLTHLSKPHRFLAKMSVPTLYLVLFTMPLSGIIMSQAGGHPINVYGWFTVVQMVDKNPGMAMYAAIIHSITGWILIGLIIMHSLAVLYHAVCLKDRLLTRMWKKM